MVQKMVDCVIKTMTNGALKTVSFDGGNMTVADASKS